MADDRPPLRRRDRALRSIAAVLAVSLLVVLGGAWYALRVIQRLPAELAEQGRDLGRTAVEEVGALVRAFRTGSVQRRFTAYTTRLAGTSYLQVATLEQQQVFEMRDSAAVLWGTVELPPVVVQATAPVTTTYFVDLESEWRLELREDERRVLVLAPPLRFNKPAIDVSRLRWQVVEGSLLRDEQVVVERLRREMMGRATIQASADLPKVRETGRRQVERFVRNWLLQSFGTEARSHDVVVFFADETAAWQRARGELPGPAPVASPR